MTIRKVQADDPAWLKLAFENQGVKEIVGKRHNPDILGYFKDAGFAGIKDDETPWCMAFVNAMLVRSGLPGTKSLAARSGLNWGKDSTDNPRRGDLCIIKRGSGWQGHIFFFLGFEGKRIVGLGGNQSNAVTIATFPRSALLGFRTKMNFNPVTGNSKTTRAQGLIGAGTATMTAAAAATQAESEPGGIGGGFGQTLMDLGLSLVTTLTGWLIIVALGVIGVGIWWTWRERDGWWQEKGF